MTSRAVLAQNLAYSLTLSDWSRPTLVSMLHRRLPSALYQHAAGIADGLLVSLPTPYAPPPTKVATALRTLSDFDRVFRYCQARNTWPSPDLSTGRMTPTRAFQALDLPQVADHQALAEWLLLSPAKLDDLADPLNRHERHGDLAVNHYHRRLVPKSDGRARLLEAPKQRLKAVQRGILRGILDHLTPHRDAFGFVSGRNCQMAAARHAGEAVVMGFDLANFFLGIDAARIYGLFRCLGYPHAVSRTLTALCTTATPPHALERLPFQDRARYRAPHLPQGAPTSPALANQLCHRLDTRLSALAKSLGANYSRYADDITLSGDTHIVAPISQLVPRIVEDEGFHLNPGKTRIMPATTRQTVTGLTVNQHLNVRRKDFDRLKAVIHACSKPEDTRLTDPAFRASLLGRIGWVESVNPARGQKLRHLLHAAWTRRFTP